MNNEENEVVVILRKDLQYPDWWKRGHKFLMNKETGLIFGYEPSEKKWMQSPIRESLAAYLWMLKTEGNKFLKEQK